MKRIQFTFCRYKEDKKTPARPVMLHVNSNVVMYCPCQQNARSSAWKIILCCSVFNADRDNWTASHFRTFFTFLSVFNSLLGKKKSILLCSDPAFIKLSSCSVLRYIFRWSQFFYTKRVLRFQKRRSQCLPSIDMGQVVLAWIHKRSVIICDRKLLKVMLSSHVFGITLAANIFWCLFEIRAINMTLDVCICTRNNDTQSVRHAVWRDSKQWNHIAHWTASEEHRGQLGPSCLASVGWTAN